MKILDAKQNTTEWLEARKGKITGSKLNDLIVKRGTGEKIGFYKLIAERLSVEEDGDETDMDRGQRLEPEAREAFSKLIDRPIITAGLCVSDENPNIVYSPDGLIEDEIDPKKYTKGVEIKCLSSARHVEAYIENKIPSEYMPQVYQSFIVNTDQKELYFVFYDPRLTAKQLFYITVTRDEIKDEIEFHKEQEIAKLQRIEEILLTKFF